MPNIPPGIRRALRLPSSADRLASELDDEVRFHLERRVADMVARGMTEDEALLEAQRRFGDTDDLRNYVKSIEVPHMRRMRLHEWWDSWMQDLRFALRQLTRSPGFFAVAVLTLSLGIGVDAIDLESARARGVAVTNTPGVVADDVADLAMAMLIDRLRSIVAGERFIRAGQWLNGPYPFARSLTGKRLGIVGLGAIGQAVARRAEAFRLRVKWYGPRPKPHLPYEYVPDLEQLARDSDALLIACSGGKETRHLIDARILAALGPSGVLVNVARGSIVDVEALIAALRSRQLAGAALDVLERQPEVPPELLALDNVLLTPHLGTATRETRGRMAEMVLESLLDYFAGRALQRRVV